MKGDFSRLTFDPAKQFSRVLMQQGRVQLDADWNEQSSLLLHHLRSLARALVGPYGGVDDAFSVTKGEGDKLNIGAGTYFVEGIMCANPDDDDRLVFTPPAEWQTKNDGPSRPAGDYLVYLLVAERHVTFVNDASIRERALGDGVDTATRTKVVCVVSAAKVDQLGRLRGAARDTAVNNALKVIRPSGPPPKMLAAVVKSQANPRDICTVPPFAQYRGAGNQLYRVEIHAPAQGDNGPTFKWSRENGSVVFPVVEGAQGKRLFIKRYGRDGRFTLQKGDWVEFEDDALVASGVSNPLARVESVDGDSLTLNTEPPENFGEDKSKHALLRRWDYATHRKDAAYTFAGGLITINTQDATKKYPLEQGIEVTFKADGGEFRRGDYWLIPARTEGNEIDWPEGKFLPARRAEGGIAPLAVITVGNDGQIGGGVTDLRSLIQPAAQPVEPVPQ